jgi:hypothetical protein
MPDEKTIIKIMVINCARCGESHEVNFAKFSLEGVDINGDIFTHWGMCPETSEPILLKIVEY